MMRKWIAWNRTTDTQDRLQRGPGTAVACLALAILIGSIFRVHGIDWGTDPDTGKFQSFHPDEKTLIQNARWVGENLRQIKMPYGLFPAYLLWGASQLTGIPIEPATNAETRQLFLLARWLTVLAAVATIWATYAIGNRVGQHPTGVLAAFLIALCYGHIQQSHYYTVDPILTALASLCLLGILRLPGHSLLPVAACGVAAGLATGTRLVAVLLILPFLVQHARAGWLRRPRLALSDLASPQTGVFVLSMAGAALACEPFSVLDLQLFLGRGAVLTWMKSLEVSLGGSIFSWSLYDFGTTAFLFHLTDTIPYALGLPLFAASLGGCVMAIARRDRPALVVLSWIVIYFLAVGGHHLKPVRYIIPLLPPLIVLAAQACVYCLQHPTRRPLGIAITTIVAVPSMVLGLMTWNPFGVTDSRIQARRWIATNVPADAAILTEGGGFPSDGLFAEHIHRRQLRASELIRTAPCVSEAARIRDVQRLAGGVEWFGLIEENRQRHFLAVPAAYPVGYGFYERLRTGELGFELAARFMVPAGIGPIQWQRSYDEPTMTAFDHPTVSVYRKAEGRDPGQILAAWEKLQMQSPDEQALLNAAASIRSGSPAQAIVHLDEYVTRHPDHQIGQILLRAARGSGAAVVINGYASCNQASLQQLLDLDLPDVAMEAAGLFVAHARSVGLADHVASTLHNAGAIAFRIGDLEGAVRYFEEAWQLDRTKVAARMGYAQACAGLGRRQEARMALREVLDVEPHNETARTWLRTLAGEQ